MKFIVTILLFAIMLPAGDAAIYYCGDHNGKTTFRDSECGPDEETIRIIADEVAADTEADDRAVERAERSVDKVVDDGKPGRLIYADQGPLAPPYDIKLHELRIIAETDDNLVVDVIYTYEHDIPVDEVRLFVMPNHGYWSTAHIKIRRGYNVGRASIGLSKSNMNRDRKTRSFTDTLRVRFEHYPSTSEYNGVIWTETVAYGKSWVLRK